MYFLFFQSIAQKGEVGLPEKALVQECCFKDSDVNIRIHFHNAYELLFVKTGKIRINIDNNTYEGEAGSVFVIGCFEEHSLELRSALYERYYVILDPLRLEYLITDRRLMAPLRNRPKGFCHRFDVSGCMDRIEILFRRLVQEYEDSGEYSDLMGISLVTELLILLLRSRPTARQALSAPGNNAVFAVQTYIDSHYAEPISISNLAARVFLTPCYLTHCFKEATGYSPKQYLMRTRLACAKDLLVHTALPVSEVAFRAGFSDVNNFIRTFRRETGMTPLRYRDRETQT